MMNTCARREHLAGVFVFEGASMEAPEKTAAAVIDLHPELNDAFTKVAPEFYNRMIDELVRMADKFENPQPLIVICPDDKGEPWFQCSEAAFNNLPWLLGAIEMAKASIAAPVMAEFEIEETDGAKE
jgi:hypothetical protein